MISKIKTFWRDTSGLAASEVALMLPILLTLLLAIVDFGNALILDKKTMNASQIVADLMTRRPIVTTGEVTDAVAAARMAVMPYETAPLGVDIVSIRFVGANADPTVLWRETVNMDENTNATEIARGLGVGGEGVIVVTTQYNFDPVFTQDLIGETRLEEIAVMKPRRGSFVELE
jgi:Flp pilus assembly protein TadG